MCATWTSESRLLRIAVDGMGGDRAPEQVVLGAAEAARELGVEVTVVGQPSVVQPLLDSHPGLRFVPASQVIGMDEHPGQVAGMLIEPIMIVLLGVGVGTLLAAVLLPIYNLAGAI